jgi:sterol desaturase/sphingolipid hydroxylase (fatty acid hydroxylase superfamily)
MDDLTLGVRNKRGDWTPTQPGVCAPVFAWPPRPLAWLKWLPGYFLPYNLLFAASALAWWQWVVPDVEVMKTPAPGWIARLYVVNAAAVFLFYGLFELRLYVLRAQGTRFKYNARWPAEQRSPAFMFGRQNVDNIIRMFASGVTVWTALEVGMLWAYANGYAPWLAFAEHPLWLFTLALLVPVIHETHFFVLHRALHVAPLYRFVHKVHHNSVNPSPWSSLSMHPIEHLGYLGVALWHLVLPSNPILALYQLHFAGFGAVPGHVGFHRVELGAKAAFDPQAYLHYLHHKLFEVNYGGGLIPFDRWFGYFHDGSPEGEARLQARYRRMKERANAKTRADTAARSDQAKG